MNIFQVHDRVVTWCFRRTSDLLRVYDGDTGERMKCGLWARMRRGMFSGGICLAIWLVSRVSSEDRVEYLEADRGYGTKWARAGKTIEGKGVWAAR